MTCKHCDYDTIFNEVMEMRRGNAELFYDLKDRAVGCVPTERYMGILATGDVITDDGEVYPEVFPAFEYCPMCGEPIPDFGDWADDDCREAAEAREESEDVEADWCIVYGYGYGYGWADRNDDNGYRESAIYVGEDSGADGIRKAIANYHLEVDCDAETAYHVKRFKVVESYDVRPRVRFERV